MVWDKSPLATAPITRAVSEIGWTRQSMRLLTALTRWAQPPPILALGRRSLILPSLPTARLMRLRSEVESSINSATSLNVSATLPAVLSQWTGRRAEKSPFLNAVRARRISRRSASLPVGCAPPLAAVGADRRCAWPSEAAAAPGTAFCDRALRVGALTDSSRILGEGLF